MNNDNIYKLYKKIFNNKFLTNHIYKFVRYENKRLYKFKKYRYNDATFNWMSNNNHFKLIIDKIKNNIKFDSFSFNSILNFFQYLNKIKEEDGNEETETEIEMIISLFYNDNKIKLENTEFIDIKCTDTKPKSLFFMCFYCSNYQFLKLVYENEIKSREKEEKEEELHNQIKDDIFYYYNRDSKTNNILDVSLSNGNLEIIKFLFTDEIGLFYDKSGIKNQICPPQIIKSILNSSFISENRDIIIEYIFNLFNENGYNLNQFINGYKFNESNQHFQSLYYKYHKKPTVVSLPLTEYKNVLKLNLKNLKKLYELDILLISNDTLSFINFIYFHNICSFKSDIYDNHSTSCSSSNFIYNLSLFNYILNNNNDNSFLIIIKKLIYLLNFKKQQPQIPTSDHQQLLLNINDNYFYSINNDQIITKKNKLTSIIKSFKSIFKSTNHDNNNNNNMVGDINENEIINIEKLENQIIEPINYENFNLERELKRLYIFDFLSKLIDVFISKLEWVNLVIDFSSKFNEHNLIFDKLIVLKSPTPQPPSLTPLVDDDNKIDYQFDYENLIKISLINADCKLIEILNQLLNQTNISDRFKETFKKYEKIIIKPPDIFNVNSIPIQQQLDYLESVLLNHNFISKYIKEKVLNNIFSNKNLNQDNIFEINLIFQKYFNSINSNDLNNNNNYKYFKSFQHYFA